jgi:hypothetical protein
MITFPSDSQLSSIASSAFDNCPSLASICIPSRLKCLFGDYSQQLCIDLPDSDAHDSA